MPNTYRLNSHGMFDRRQDRNMRRVIFLSVEGTKTEVEYFGHINKYKTSLGVESVVEIHVLKRDDTKSSPEQVLDLLDEYMSLRTTSKLKDLIAKERNAHGCIALKTTHGQHLADFKYALDDSLDGSGIQLVTISRPTAYGEYAPYRFVHSEEEFTAQVLAMRA